MQYLLMIYDNEKTFATMPEATRNKLMQEYGVFTQGIVKSGHFRAGAQLQPSSTATKVKLENGKRATTDGPFVETKEQLGGYYLVECKDLNEALSIAGRIPSLEVGGTIEVRPILPAPTQAPNKELAK
jgi:hypothetical protein